MNHSFLNQGEAYDLIVRPGATEKQPAKVLKAALRCGSARPAMARSMISLRKQQLLADPSLRLTA